MIEFDLDWYGPYNRRSAVCDYLELMAMAGESVSRAKLSDAIRDSSWTALLADRVQDSDRDTRDATLDVERDDTDLADDLEEADIRASEIAMVLYERQDLLGSAYPFTVGDDGYGLTYRGLGDDTGPYLAFLAITVAHAAKLVGLPRNPVYIFEDSLTSTLNALGMPTACLGAEARLSRDFPTTLVRGCQRVGLVADPSRAPYRTFANEEGCDTITNVWPQDRRVGGVQFIGQATCAKSTDWKAKIMEPPVGHWEDWLQRKLSPIAFLSVPHHVQDDMRKYLISADRKRDVLDRLRLALTSRPLREEEFTAIACIERSTFRPLG